MPTNRVTAAQARAMGLLPGTAAPRPKRVRRPVALVAPLLAVEVAVPLATRNEMNARGHWRLRDRRRREAEIAWMNAMPLQWVICPPCDPCRLTFTRTGGRRVDPDGLPTCFKHLQDAVCRWARVDDGDPALTFEYKQLPGVGPVGVRVRVEWAAPGLGCDSDGPEGE